MTGRIEITKKVDSGNRFMEMANESIRQLRRYQILPKMKINAIKYHRIK